MANGWKILTVAVLCLWWTVPTAAQPLLLTPMIRPGDPVPIATYGPQNVTPTVGSPVAPGAPADPISLIDDGTPNAFDKEQCFGWNDGVYFNIGAMALMRSDIGGMPVVRLDGIPIDRPDNPAFGPPVLGLSEMPSEYVWGPRMTIGFQSGDQFFELNGWWIDSHRSSAQVGRIGSLNLPFGDFPSPLGFVGNSNLWRQADYVEISLMQRLGSAELLYRTTTADGFQWLGGLRYLDMYERFNIYTDDDSFALGGVAQPLRQATHSTRTQNRIVGPTAGFEYATGGILSIMGFGVWGKGTAGANFSERRVVLERGDGFKFPGGRDQTTHFASILELGGFFEFIFNDGLSLRGGYQAMWVLNVYEAAEQINFNPAARNMSPATLGNVFYHGPTVELRLRF